jgi:hypothetical protein
MKKLYIVLFAVLLAVTGCKKNIEKIAEDMVMKAMTDGQWIITSFTQNGNDITTDFTGYKFKYYENRTVDAIKNDILERTGTWNGDAATMTTSANFTGAPNPIALINGSWKITNSTWTTVEANQTNGTEVKTLKLKKI